MGICQSTKTVEVEAQHKKESRISADAIRLLLLGAGQSGKSTLFKQVKILHQNGYTNEERAECVAAIHQNIVTNMLSLVESCGPTKKNITLPENLVEDAAELADLYRKSQNVVIDQQLMAKIQNLWKSPQIQQAFATRASILMLSESAQYFFDRIEKVCDPAFLPSNDDILNTRVRTTGIHTTKFSVAGANFELCDVGGQRCERRRWINCFDNVQGVLFVAAISEYDQVLEEDGHTNRLHEALNLFDEVCNSRFFTDTAMILFLNKKDVFEQKIKHTSINVAFPEYDGPQQFNASVDYIKAQFEAVNESESRQIYTHVTCATDTDQINKVVLSVRDLMLVLNLQSSGLM